MASKTFSEAEALDRDGYVVIPELLTQADATEFAIAIDVLHARAKEDPLFRTGGTLHVDGLKEYGAPFDRAWTDDRVVAAVTHLLGSEFTVSRAHFRQPLAGEGSQTLHADYFFPPDGQTMVATMLVALDDFRADNGSTRLIPGSQKLPKLNVPKDHDTPFPGQIIVEMAARSALLFNGHIWHSGTRNRSGAPRRAVQVVFTHPSARQY